ncbi:MAG TPA: hypothetical protein V6C57_24230 [Coleofasciculaceae cyanobacterium]
MARLKRGSEVLEKATRRMAGMRSINPTLDFGDGLSLAEYNARIQTLQMQLSNYNTMLSGVDEAAGQIRLLEQELRSYSEKMLMRVAIQYGKDSLQYVQAGGKHRKRSTQRTVSATPTAAVTVPIAEAVLTNGNGTKASVVN